MHGSDTGFSHQLHFPLGLTDPTFVLSPSVWTNASGRTWTLASRVMILSWSFCTNDPPFPSPIWALLYLTLLPIIACRELSLSRPEVADPSLMLTVAQGIICCPQKGRTSGWFYTFADYFLGQLILEAYALDQHRLCQNSFSTSVKICHFSEAVFIFYDIKAWLPTNNSLEEDVKSFKFLSEKHQVTQLTNTFWMKIAVGNRRCRPCPLSIQGMRTLPGQVMTPPVQSFQKLCCRTNILSQLSRQNYLQSHWGCEALTLSDSCCSVRLLSLSSTMLRFSKPKGVPCLTDVLKIAGPIFFFLFQV